MFTATVIKTINIRIGEASSRATLYTTLEKGSTLNIRHAIRGQSIEHNDIWYVLDNGHFAWSGGIQASSNIPLIIDKYILVTADDYGIYDEIDNGVEWALKNGWINSVAVLVNNDELENESRLVRLRDFLERNHLTDRVHVGLHFTIASGKPLSKKLRYLTNSNGFFKHFWLIHDGYRKGHYLEEVGKEFELQLEKFKKVFGTPDHITSHFDVLSYNEAFLNLTLKRAHLLSTSMRSLNYIPYGKRIGMDIITTADIMSARETERCIKKYELANQTIISVPDSSIVDHYGPPGFIPVWNYYRRSRKKQEDVSKWIDDFKTDDTQTTEIVYHLIQHEAISQRAFVRKFREKYNEYPGLHPNYFDGRVAEMMSLEAKRPWESYNYNLKFKPKTL